MHISHADLSAAQQGKLLLVTSPRVSDEVFRCFDSMRKSHPIFQDTPIGLQDGCLLIEGAFHDDMRNWIRQTLDSAEKSVADYHQRKKESEERERLSRLELICQQASRLGISVK